jgi:cytochrome c551/c552
MFAAQDQQAFHISVSGNLHAIAEVAEEEEAARLALYESEDNKPQVDAQAIFETRCIACHKFDVKQPTAPAYNDVIPKYEGNEAELVKFILNPYPVNPTDYPAGMANQGLSPAEGKAMAKWLLDKVVGGGDSEEAKPETEEEAPATEEEATASAE